MNKKYQKSTSENKPIRSAVVKAEVWENLYHISEEIEPRFFIFGKGSLELLSLFLSRFWLFGERAHLARQVLHALRVGIDLEYEVLKKFS